MGACILLLSALFLTNLPLRAEKGLIRFYQRFASPVAQYVVTCRYQPTCSVYALEELERRGFWQGNLKIAGRLLMCSPFGYLVDLVSGEETS